MDDQLEAELADMQAMFEHPGWIALKRHTQARLDAFRSGFPFNVQNEQQLYFLRGVAATLGELLNMDRKSEPEESDDPV